MTKNLLIATHNLGKVREFEEMLPHYTIQSAKDFDLPEPEETGLTFSENAALKANYASSITGLVSIADDSGLSVDALNGAPGIYSARWAETENGRDFYKAMQRVHDELKGDVNGQKARFVCFIAIGSPDFVTVPNKKYKGFFQGVIEGNLCWPPRGDKGFGYDPIFMPKGYDKTFAEMEPAEKHSLSHRARAVEKLKTYLLSSRA